MTQEKSDAVLFGILGNCWFLGIFIPYSQKCLSSSMVCLQYSSSHFPVSFGIKTLTVQPVLFWNDHLHQLWSEITPPSSSGPQLPWKCSLGWTIAWPSHFHTEEKGKAGTGQRGHCRNPTRDSEVTCSQWCLPPSYCQEAGLLFWGLLLLLKLVLPCLEW